MKEIIKTKNEPYNKNNLWLNDGLHEYKDGKWTSIGGCKYYYYNYRSVENMNIEGDGSGVDAISDISDAAMYITEICYNTGNGTDKVHTNLEEFLNAEKNVYWQIYYFCTNEPLPAVPDNYYMGPAPIKIDVSSQEVRYSDQFRELFDKQIMLQRAVGSIGHLFIELEDTVAGSIQRFIPE